MTCAEFHELAAAYALGALEPEEQRLCDLHLEASEHEGCRERVAEARRTVAAMGESIAPVRPREGVWKQIKAGLAPAERPAASSRGSRVAAWIFAVAAAGAVAFGIRQWHNQAELRERVAVAEGDNAEIVARSRKASQDRAACLKDLQAARDDLKLRDDAVALLGIPETHVVPFAPQGGSPTTGRAVVNLPSKKGIVIARGLAPQDGKDYELWVIREGQAPQPAGVFHGAAETSVFAIDAAALADGADTLAITLEPAGGSKAPTSTPFLLGAIPKG